MRLTFPLIALAAIAAPALAAPQANIEAVTVEIPYGDVDLTRAEGRAAFEARVEAKLIEACTRDVNGRYAHGRNAVDSKCVADAKIMAFAEVERVAATEASALRKVAVY